MVMLKVTKNPELNPLSRKYISGEIIGSLGGRGQLFKG